MAERPWWRDPWGVPPWWPWAPTAPASAVGHGDQPPSPPRPRVLLVDDEPDVRLWLGIALREGWEVFEAEDGVEALLRVEDHEPDVVVLDQRMPRLTGLETASALRERGFTRPIVLFSAFTAHTDVAETRRLRLTPISKVDHHALLALLEALRADHVGREA